MSYILGIDTGGTYTDGVIYEMKEHRVVSKTKALTTRTRLENGIAQCLSQLDASLFSKVLQVNLSTTLATNAIVEHRGNKIALFCLGGKPKGDLPAEHLFEIQGSYDIRGRQICALDTSSLARFAEAIKDQVGAVAVSGFASTRNNEHELLAKKIIQDHTGLPVVCAHEMSSSLGYYDRTVTTALNARLLSVIYELLAAVKEVMERFSLRVPLMIVTGSGHLVSEKVALERPIETVLSGPAASISGALHLADHPDGRIVDMGGTTTDIAQACGGKVAMNPQGADVGGYHLHINAADICTFGMGGDSRIFLGAENKLLIASNKVYPVCRGALDFPELFQEMKELRSACLRERDRRELLDGFFLYLPENGRGLDHIQQQVTAYLEQGPHTLYAIRRQMGDRFRMEDIRTLEEKGIVMRIALTPTDVLHVLGEYTMWNTEASEFLADYMAQIYGLTLMKFVQHCREVIENRIAYCCKSSSGKASGPIIGVGAPSGSWLPGAAKILGQEICLPEHKEVANAVGAAVASVCESARALIRYNSVTGTYMLFLPDGRSEFDTLSAAKERGRTELERFVRARATASGCQKPKVVLDETCMETENCFVEYEIFAAAHGRSKWLDERG